MSKKWNEMTQQEKNYTIVSLIFAVAGLAFIVLDIVTEWKYANLGWAITFGLYLATEAKKNWNENRKLAILDLVLAIALVVVNILTMIL